MSNAVAQSLGRIALLAFVFIALLAVLTTARYASSRVGRRTPAPQTAARPLKGEVRRSDDGTLEYFDGRRWTATPPRPNDDAF
jgi:hypothetical protein